MQRGVGRHEGAERHPLQSGLHDTDRVRSLGGNVSGRIDNPADFGKTVAFLCSQGAAFISGTAVLVDGAMSAGLL